MQTEHCKEIMRQTLLSNIGYVLVHQLLRGFGFFYASWPITVLAKELMALGGSRILKEILPGMKDSMRVSLKLLAANCNKSDEGKQAGDHRKQKCRYMV